MNRTHWTLGGIFLLQLVLILAFRSPFSNASAPAAARALFPNLETLGATRIALEGQDRKKLTLERIDDTWRIADLGGFPADGPKVEKLLEDLGEIEVRRPVVSSTRYHESFKVDAEKNEGRVRIWAAGQDDSKAPQVDLIVGTSPNYRTLHVRAAGEDEVYEARGLTAYDLQPTRGSWIDRNLIDLGGDEITGLTLTNAKGSFELVREGETWQVVTPAADHARALDSAKVDSLISSVTSLRLADGAGKSDLQSHGLSQPAAALVLHLTSPGTTANEGDGTTPAPVARRVAIEIGGTVAGEESQRYVTRGGWEFTGTLWESSVKRLLDQTLADLEPES